MELALIKKISRESKDYLAITFGLVLYALGWGDVPAPLPDYDGRRDGYFRHYLLRHRSRDTSILLHYQCHILRLCPENTGTEVQCKNRICHLYADLPALALQWLLKDDAGHLPQLLGPGQDFMACVIGAGMLGFGIGIVFCNNGSTGGTDIIAWIINKYKDVTLGRMMMYCDIVIISSCYFIFHDWRRVLFGFCVLFIMSIVIDYVINSARQSVQFLIFSRKYEEIAEGISTRIDRGVTLLDGQGWYSKTEYQGSSGTGKKDPVARHLPPRERHRPQRFHLAKQRRRRIRRRIRQAESEMNFIKRRTLRHGNTEKINKKLRVFVSLCSFKFPSTQ